MFEGLPELSPLIGTIPQWGMFILLAIAVVRTSPQWLQTLITAAKDRKDRLGKRISELEQKLHDCEEKCDQREAVFKEEIDRLKTKVNNEAWQRTQSEISLVTTLVRILPKPELQQVLEALQRQSRMLPADATALGSEPQKLDGPVADAGPNGNGGK